MSDPDHSLSGAGGMDDELTWSSIKSHSSILDPNPESTDCSADKLGNNPNAEKEVSHIFSKDSPSPRPPRSFQQRRPGPTSHPRFVSIVIPDPIEERVPGHGRFGLEVHNLPATTLVAWRQQPCEARGDVGHRFGPGAWRVSVTATCRKCFHGFSISPSLSQGTSLAFPRFSLFSVRIHSKIHSMHGRRRKTPTRTIQGVSNGLPRLPTGFHWAPLGWSRYVVRVASDCSVHSDALCPACSMASIRRITRPV